MNMDGHIPFTPTPTPTAGSAAAFNIALAETIVYSVVKFLSEFGFICLADREVYSVV
jgi:hypothetical protein